jgi:hypothetical protein
VPSRILLDQNAPLGLRRSLSPHEVVAARQMGWSRLTNGDLIRAAEEDGFDMALVAKFVDASARPGNPLVMGRDFRPA